MHIAFNSGHGDWASMQLAVLTQRFRDSGLFMEASPPMVRKFVLEGQERFAANWRPFAAGQIPFHLWADASNRGLGAEFYWRWHHNRDRAAAVRVPLPVSYGGRPARTSLSAWTGQVMTMDYTACLTAHLLKLFPALDSALDRIYIAPSLFAVIQGEIQKLAEDQTDYIERAEELLSLLEHGAVTLLPAPDVTQGNFSALQPVDRQEWRVAEDHGLRIVTDKFATEMFGDGEVPEALRTLRVYPQSVIGTLRSAGELIGDVTQGTHPQVSIPGDRCDLPRGARLLVDRAFLEELLDIGGYDAATLYFSLYCIDDIRDDIRADIQGSRYRQKVKDWLERLLVELKRRKASGKLEVLSLPRSLVEDHRHQPLTHELRELVSCSEGRGLPVWIDDRALTSYPGSSSGIQVLGIHDILDILRARDAITAGKYLECHHEVIQSGMVFRVPAPDYLFGVLEQAKIDPHTGGLIENQPLSRLRQSVAVCLYTDSCIGTTSVRPGMLVEREQYIMELRRLTDEVMAMIWTNDGLDDRRCAAMANWLYDQCFPTDARVATDPHFQTDMVQGLAVEHSARISLCSRFLDRPSAIKAYYRWLFPNLEIAWRNQEELRKKVFDHYAQLITGTVRELSRSESNAQWIARLVDPMRFLPPEMLAALLEHPQLESTLRPLLHWGTHIDSLDLFVPDEIWTDISNKCIEQGPDIPYMATVANRQMEICFRQGRGIGDAFVVSGATPTGRQSEQTILYPFARLTHQAAGQRLAWLDDLIEAGLLQSDCAIEWRERLGSDEYTEAAAGLRGACLRSPPYFFGTAALALGILNLSSEHWDVILPENWDVLESYANCLGSEPGALESESGSLDESRRLECQIGELAAVPFGEPFDLATQLTRLLKEGGTQTETLKGILKGLSLGSKNPVALENLLASVLRNPELRDDLSVSCFVFNLLTPEPGSLYGTAFDIYTELLQLIWSHFRLNPIFSTESYRRRVRGAYIYADRLLNTLVREASTQVGYLDVAAETVDKMNASLSKRINPFSHREDVDVDVACPAFASRWRTVIGATLQILARGAPALDSSASAVLGVLENLLSMMFGETTPFKLESLEPFDLPPSPENSPISNKGWSIALDLKALLSDSQGSGSNEPMDFWSIALERADPQVLAGFMSVLSRRPVPGELHNQAAAFVDAIIEGHLFRQDTKLLFRTIASLLPRLPIDISEAGRERLFRSALVGVRADPTLWSEVCEMFFQVDRLSRPEDRVSGFLDTLEKLAPLIPRESKSFGEFSGLLRRIEALMPASNWPRLWNAARMTLPSSVG